ncbi:glycosyltransferase family 4 protein [Ideonella sp. YS5]|uniref:glycosyltransferase family 4 protein n=1 Tax=Ideonella sp. YS5 TaxID=3453714 RepID=UPI003EE8BA2E
MPEQRHTDSTAAFAPSQPPTLPRRAGRPLQVLIDGFNLSLDKGTGVATYGRNLSHTLKDMGANVDVLYGAPIKAKHDDLLKEVMFFDATPPPLHRIIKTLRMVRAIGFRNGHRAFRIPVTGAVVTQGVMSRLPRFDRLWNAYRVFDRGAIKFDMFRSLQRIRLPEAPDIVHWTYPLPMRVAGAPNIYTLHDLVPLRLPYTTLDRKAGYLALMQWIARTADHIVTVSEASRRDIIQLLGVPEDRVTNTYQAVHVPRELAEVDDDTVADTVGRNFGLEPRGYFLFYGSIEPKKNVARIIEAFMSANVGSQLVIVGARAWRSALETRLLESVPTADRRVRRIEYLPFPALIHLIRGARAVVFPSLYEGFGLPVLEAMQLGTPVIASTASSIPEVAGDAALLVDPYRTEAIAEAMKRLDADDDLCFELGVRGRRQAEKFSEAAYAQRLAALYARLV